MHHEANACPGIERRVLLWRVLVLWLVLLVLNRRRASPWVGPFS